MTSVTTISLPVLTGSADADAHSLALTALRYVQCETLELQDMPADYPSSSTRRLLISTGAAASVAGCHPTTILRAIERGELEAVRLGRKGDHRVPVDALNQWLRPTGSDNERRTTREKAHARERYRQQWGTDPPGA